MDLVNASNEDDMNKGLGQRMSEGNAAQVDDYNSEVDELCTKVEKMDTVNASNEDDKNKGLRQRTSEGNAAQVDDYNSEVDELCTKVDKMDTVNASNEDVMNKRLGQRMSEGNAVQVDDYNNEVDEIFTKVDKLEQTVNEIEQFYSNTKLKEPNTSRGALIIKDKEKEKQIPSMKKLQQDASRREAAAAKRMQELMRQFGSIFRQITQHKWAWPFMQPVDVEGLGLHDYYQIIDRPMDFSTIKNQMEAKDGTGYKHVHEICSDMRLVFKNAMKYNDEKSNVHVMAKTLLEKFEEKWLQFLPKVIEEEKRREEEEAEAQINAQLAQEAAHAKLTREVNNELNAIDMRLEELRDMVVKRCRRMSTVEKRELGAALTILSPEDLTKALEIVARGNPDFQATAEEVEIDINAQSESTLWRLKFFVKDALKRQSKTSSKDDNKNITPTDEDDNNIVSIRRREICDALAKTAKNRKNNKNITPTDKDNNNIVSKHKRQISNTLIKAAIKRKRKSSS